MLSPIRGDLVSRKTQRFTATILYTGGKNLHRPEWRTKNVDGRFLLKSEGVLYAFCEWWHSSEAEEYFV